MIIYKYVMRMGEKKTDREKGTMNSLCGLQSNVINSLEESIVYRNMDDITIIIQWETGENTETVKSSFKFFFLDLW